MLAEPSGGELKPKIANGRIGKGGKDWRGNGKEQGGQVEDADEEI